MDIRTSPLMEMAGEAERPTRRWTAWLVGIGQYDHRNQSERRDAVELDTQSRSDAAAPRRCPE